MTNITFLFLYSHRFEFIKETFSICLTHWGRVTHICVSELTIIGSDNGLSPGRRQAIIWTNDGILLIGSLGTNFSEKLIEIYSISFKIIHWKISSGKWRPSCLGFDVLIIEITERKTFIHYNSLRSISLSKVISFMATHNFPVLLR